LSTVMGRPHYCAPQEGELMEWARILAYITGTVDQQLLLRNEYLVAENRILKAQLQGRLRLSDAERARLGEIGHRLGRKALSEVATAALPETMLTWYRRLVARKFDGSRAHRRPGRPPIDKEVEELIVGMAKENRSWGYDRIVGALANLGYRVSKETGRHGARRRKLRAVPCHEHGLGHELLDRHHVWARKKLGGTERAAASSVPCRATSTA
jgi:putative transposase